MKQILVIVLLAIGLAGCDSGDANSYAANLRARSQGQSSPPTMPPPPNKSASAQTVVMPTMPPPPDKATSAQAAVMPTMPPPPDRSAPAQSIAMPSIFESSGESAWRDTSKDPDPIEAIVSIAAFAGAAPLFYVACTIVFGLAVRKKVRK